MAFNLKRRGEMAKQLKRLVRAELRTALESVSHHEPDEAAIHEARKSVKKVRAILRLLRAPLGRTFAKENARLRSVSSALSTQRDADVTLETLGALHGRYPLTVRSSVVRSVGRGLESRQQQVKVRAGPMIHRELKDLSRSSLDVPERVRKAASFKAVREGAARGYARAQALSRTLAVEAEATAFHEWRKRVKSHWYHVRLFEKLHRGAWSRAHTLARLEGLLGDDHDLAMLHAILLDGDDRYGSARSRTIVIGAIARRQAALRRRALALGHRTFARTPRQFAESVTIWWRIP
jgi:CHAD domain-containing protein